MDYFFLEPRYQFLRLDTSRNLLQLMFFSLVAFTINLLTSNLQNSNKNIERLSQQLAEENAEQLRMAMSAGNLGMWDWNLVTGEIKWSLEHALLLGLDYKDFDGKYETFDARVYPDDREQLNHKLQEALQTQTIYKHEFRIIWPNGSILWVS